MLSAFPEKNHQTIDKLTGLPTRALFDKELNDRVDNHPGNFGMLYVDADDLKVTNDTYGHAAGDELLQNIASTLEEAVRHKNQNEGRELDYVGRDVFRLSGRGDEFAVLLAGSEINLVRERLKKRLADKGIRASVGGRMHHPGESASEFLHDVDQMMYAEKEAHREARKHEFMASLPRRQALLFWGADRLMRMAKLEYKVGKH